MIMVDSNFGVQSVVGPLFSRLGVASIDGLRLFDLLHPDDRAVAAEAFIAVQTNDSTVVRHVRAVHTDGSVLFLELLFTVAASSDDSRQLVIAVRERADLSVSADDAGAPSSAVDREIQRVRHVLQGIADSATGSTRTAPQVTNSIQVALGAASIAVYLFDTQSGTLTPVARQGLFEDALTTVVTVRKGGPFNSLMAGKRPVFLGDLTVVRDQPEIDASVLTALFAEMTTGLIVPCTWGDHKGVVAIGGLVDGSIAGELGDDIARATRKLADGWLNQAQERQEQQRRYTTVLENASDFAAIVDREMRFTFVSPSVARMAGKTPDEMIGKSATNWVNGAKLAAGLGKINGSSQESFYLETGPTAIGERILELTVRNMFHEPLVCGWLINGRDVTTAHRMLKKQQETAAWRTRFASLSTRIANTPSEELAGQLETHLNTMTELLHADRCVTWVANSLDNTAVVLAEAVREGVQRIQDSLPPIDLARLRSLIDDARMIDDQHPQYKSLQDLITIDSAPSIGASSFFPLRAGGAFIGVMLVLRFHPTPFDEESKLLAMTLADTVAAALARRAAFEHLEAQALSDSLTNLGNRRALGKAMTRALHDVQRPGGVGLIYCDVDNFKLINDTLGHDAGDELLCEIARRMRIASRSTDTLIRLGGDEFVVLLDGVQSDRDAFHYAKHLRRSLMMPFSLHGQEINPSFCLGISFAERTQLAEDQSLLMTKADLALLEAKKAGQGEIAVYDPIQAQKARNTVSLAGELNQGINRDELRVHFQPIVDLADPRRIVSVECLVRWQHPTRGLIFPDVFIPIGEHNKMITRITGTVMATGLQALGAARSAGMISNETSLAVNVSVRDLRASDFLSRVERAIETSGLPPSTLHIELTESSAIDDRRVFQTLLGIRGMGVQIAIDDFGTGYASLSYLRDIPASMVKIDRSFVQQMDNRRVRLLIKAAIAMSHELEMTVVAEGIETSDQLALLCRLGVQEGQGYLLSRPLRAEQVPELLFATEATE